MKNKKLKLNELDVQSFVTSLDKQNQLTVKGGVTENCGQSFNQCATLPVNNCNIASYNDACPTVPVAACQPFSDVPALCFQVQATLICFDVQATVLCTV